jgi:hypothetical protein
MLLTLFIVASLAAQESKSSAQAANLGTPATQQQLDDTNAKTSDPEPGTLHSRSGVDVQTVADLSADAESSTNSNSPAGPPGGCAVPVRPSRFRNPLR